MILPAIEHIKKITQSDVKLRVLALSDRDRLMAPVDSIASAIAFVIPVWSETPEGVRYWYGVWRQYSAELLTEQFDDSRPEITYKADPFLVKRKPVASDSAMAEKSIPMGWRLN